MKNMRDLRHEDEIVEVSEELCYEAEDDEMRQQ